MAYKRWREVFTVLSLVPPSASTLMLIDVSESARGSDIWIHQMSCQILGIRCFNFGAKISNKKSCIKENKKKSVFSGGPVGGGGRSRSPRTSRRLCNWCQKTISYPLAVDKYSPISHEFGRKLSSWPDRPFQTDGTTGTTHPLWIYSTFGPNYRQSEWQCTLYRKSSSTNLDSICWRSVAI